MAIEHALARASPKPWGVMDLGPWSHASPKGDTIGEIWYERSSGPAEDSSLLLKLLFTSQSLSIQVHPDDAFAHTIGLPRGKSEVWYVLSAAPEAKIALGLKQPTTRDQLREAVADGSIANLVLWRPVSSGDTIFVPAGTIHAIGAGLVIAELQQRCDATFRLFDYGSARELHIESAMAVANTGSADFLVPPSRLTDERTLLVSDSHFVFEKIDLPPDSAWRLEADSETWLLVLSGGASAESFEIGIGDAVFAQSDHIAIHAGAVGMVVLVARAGNRWAPHLLQRLGHQGRSIAGRPPLAPTSLTQTRTVPTNGRLETN